jgi:hypothetical protein
LPQKLTLGVSQVVPLQHPFGQFCEQPVQALFTHAKPPQSEQAKPKAPHTVEMFPG